MCLAYPVLVLSTEVSQSYQVSIWEWSDPNLAPAEVSTCFPVQRDWRAAAGPYAFLRRALRPREMRHVGGKGGDTRGEGDGSKQQTNIYKRSLLLNEQATHTSIYTYTSKEPSYHTRTTHFPPKHTNMQTDTTRLSISRLHKHARKHLSPLCANF